MVEELFGATPKGNLGSKKVLQRTLKGGAASATARMLALLKKELAHRRFRSNKQTPLS